MDPARNSVAEVRRESGRRDKNIGVVVSNMMRLWFPRCAVHGPTTAFLPGMCTPCKLARWIAWLQQRTGIRGLPKAVNASSISRVIFFYFFHFFLLSARLTILIR